MGRENATGVDVIDSMILPQVHLGWSGLGAREPHDAAPDPRRIAPASISQSPLGSRPPVRGGVLP